MVNFINMLATFTSPEDISVTPMTLLWIIPLLIVISLVYKTTKIRYLLWKKLFRETVVLIITTSLFMVFAAGVIWAVIEFAV